MGAAQAVLTRNCATASFVGHIGLVPDPTYDNQLLCTSQNN